MKRPKLWEPQDSIERLYWGTDLQGAREGWGLHPFTIAFAMAGIDPGLFGANLPAAYPRRVCDWIIRQLDTVPRVTADHPRALCVMLHKPEAPSLLFGYFDLHTSAGKGLLIGLRAYHKRVLRKVAREQKRQQLALGRVWILSELARVSVGEFPRDKRHRNTRRPAVSKQAEAQPGTDSSLSMAA